VEVFAFLGERVLPRPESLGDLVLVSSPAIDFQGRRVFYVVTRVDLDLDRYESSIWGYDPSVGRVVLQSGPFDACPRPGPLGERYVFVRRLDQDHKKKKPGIPRAELRIASFSSTGSQLLVRGFHFSAVSWSPDGRWVAAVDTVPLGKPEDDVKVIDDLPIWFNGRGWIYNMTSKLLLVNPESGVAREVKLGLEWLRIDSVTWSPDSKQLALSVRYDRHKPYLVRVYVYNIETGEYRVLVDEFSGYGEVAWSPDGSKIAYLGHRREYGLTTHNKVYIIDAETGEYECATCDMGRNAVGTANSDVRGPSCSRRLEWSERGIFFIVSDSGKQVLYLLNPATREATRIVDPGEGVVDEFAVSRSGSIIAYTAMNVFEPKDLYVIRGGSLERITRVGESWRQKYKTARDIHVSFKASDGREIEGWLYYPPEGVDVKGWVLYIHGGPKTMWGYAFMHEFQVLAAHGYIVAAFNPRGSDGYDQEFADIRCKYGERDYQDLMEAYDYLVSKHGLPRDKAAVMGGSYGGFMTNWVVGNTDRFRVAVSMRGISNWVSMYGTSDIGWYFVEDQICCTPWKNAEKCWEKSPLRLAPNVKTPILVIHSDEDYRCWLDQAIQWFTALRVNGIEARLAVFPGEDHDLSRKGKPGHRVRRLKLILEWLDKHLHKKEPRKQGGNS
jgi:acylaminoacyl-peptidase